MSDKHKNEEFNGNEEEFKKYNNKLKEPFDSETIYYVKNKKKNILEI